MTYKQSFNFDDLWSDFRQTEQRSIHKYRKQLDVIGDQLNYLSSPLHSIQQTYEDDPLLKDILMGQLAKVTISFQAALSHILRALYADAMSSIRNGLETAWLLMYLIDTPEQRTKWVEGEKIRPKAVRKALPLTDERKALYDEMSKLTHPNRESITAYIIDRGGTKYGPIYNEFLTCWHLFNMHQWLDWVIHDLYYRLYPSAFTSNPDVPSFVHEYSKSLVRNVPIMDLIKVTARHSEFV